MMFKQAAMAMAAGRIVIPGLAGPANGRAILMANMERALENHREWLLAVYFQEWWGWALVDRAPVLVPDPRSADHQDHWTVHYLRQFLRPDPDRGHREWLPAIRAQPAKRSGNLVSLPQPRWTLPSIPEEEEEEEEGWQLI